MIELIYFNIDDFSIEGKLELNDKIHCITKANCVSLSEEPSDDTKVIFSIILIENSVFLFTDLTNSQNYKIRVNGKQVYRFTHIKEMPATIKMWHENELVLSYKLCKIKIEKKATAISCMYCKRAFIENERVEEIDGFELHHECANEINNK